jgi:hypothetical protein
MPPKKKRKLTHGNAQGANMNLEDDQQPTEEEMDAEWNDYGHITLATEYLAVEGITEEEDDDAVDNEIIETLQDYNLHLKDLNITINLGRLLSEENYFLNLSLGFDEPAKAGKKRKRNPNRAGFTPSPHFYLEPLKEEISRRKKSKGKWLQSIEGLEITGFLEYALQKLDFRKRSRTAGGGSDSLEVTIEEDPLAIQLTGRPAFEKNAIKLDGMKTGFHRRHVVAWHSIKQAMQVVLEKLTEEADVKQLLATLEQLADQLGQPDQTSTNQPQTNTNQPQTNSNQPQTNTAESGAVGTKEKHPRPANDASDSEKLKLLIEHVLSKLNSNTLNLWPGEGYENSLINVYRAVFQKWIDELDELKDNNEKAIAAWKNSKAKEFRKRITDKGGKFKNTLEHFCEVLEDFRPADDDERNGTDYQPVPFKVELKQLLQNFIDNVEYDHAFSTSREGFAEGQVVATNPAIAARILEWSDGNIADLEDQTVDKITTQLIEVFGNFMHPEKRLGKYIRKT